MPMIAPGIEAAVITWSMAASSRCAVPASISWAASVPAVFVVAVADEGDDVESLPHADTKINSATAIVACRLLMTSAPYRGVRLHGTLLARPCVRSRTTGFEPDRSTSTPTSLSTRSASILQVGSMIRANTRSRNTLSPLVADSNPKIRYAAHSPSHRWVICEDMIGNVPGSTPPDSPRSSSVCPAANRSAAAVFSAANATLSCAEPMCSIEREPLRQDHTTCTAVAPEDVFTVRTYATHVISPEVRSA
jgi:hypothetical protein